jgi:hypothetical protein
MADGTRMKQRRGTEAQWVTSNYLLADGEIGFSTDTNTVKMGNGTSHWVDLPILFETEFLPLHGTADNSLLLNGVDGSNYLNAYDADTAATANKIIKRLTDGRAKAAAATASDDLVQKAQLDASSLLLTPRTVTAASTLALTDQNGMVFVNNSSLTAQIQITVPPNSGTGSVAFPIGSVIEIIAIGAGGGKIIPGSGVTVNGVTNAYPAYGGTRLIKTGTNTWIGTSMNAVKRLPKIRLTNNGGNSYSAGSFYTCIPWGTVDSTVDFYNPDNEWFSIPGTGLTTARRVIVNKDGEYLVECNFLCTNGSAGSLVIAKMVADNTLTGGKILANQTAFGNNNAMVRRRFTAGESVGAAYQAPSGGATDIADGTSDNSCDFKITRLSD